MIYYILLLGSLFYIWKCLNNSNFFNFIEVDLLICYRNWGCAIARRYDWYQLFWRSCIWCCHWKWSYGPLKLIFICSRRKSRCIYIIFQIFITFNTYFIGNWRTLIFWTCIAILILVFIGKRQLIWRRKLRIRGSHFKSYLFVAFWIHLRLINLKFIWK